MCVTAFSDRKGLCRESGGYVYDLYKIEQEHGRLVQLEI
jgi:hypothetical protein